MPGKPGRSPRAWRAWATSAAVLALVGGCGTVVAGTPADGPEAAAVPARPTLPAAVLSVAVGDNHSCAALNDGHAWCWGENKFGQLGNAAAGTSWSSPLPVTGLPPGIAVRSLAAGGDHSCAALSNGQAWCWGANDQAELGNPAGGGNGPVRVRGLPRGAAVQSLAAGSMNSCAVLTNGQAWCWGNGYSGQPGNPAAVGGGGHRPVRVLGLPAGTAVRTVAVGTNHACAVLTDGQAWCWGDNRLEGLGNPAADHGGSTPVPVLGLPAAAAVVSVTAGFGRSCSVLSNGQAWCWGGHQGDPADVANANRPAQVPGLPEHAAAASLAAGAWHSCAALANGQAWCWGGRSSGQLGAPAGFGEQDTPVRIPGLPKNAAVLSVAVGTWSLHSCAVLTGGQAWCWGDNGSGQLGSPDPGGSGPVKVVVSRPAAASSGGTSAEADRVLGLVSPPAGSAVLGQAPDGLPGPTLAGDPVAAVRSRVWSVPLSPDAARQWAESLSPVGTARNGGFLSGYDSRTATAAKFDVIGQTRWMTDELRLSIAPHGARSYLRADALVMPASRPPTYDGATSGPRMRVTVAAPCPAGNAGFDGVTNPGAADLDRMVVPAAGPTAARVCAYDQREGGALVGDRVLGAPAAGRLAAAGAGLSLADPLHLCGMADSVTVVVALAYPGRPDVDLWTGDVCGSLVGNGHILAGDSGTFFGNLRPPLKAP